MDDKRQTLFGKLLRDLEIRTTDSVASSKSLLHTAATAGNISDLLKCLEDPAVDVNIKDDIGHTPLYMAVKNGHKSIVEILLTHGAKVNDDDDKNNFYLHVCNDEDISLLLIKAGCDMNAKDERGDTALHRVVTHENIKLVTLLLENGANVHLQNNEGMLPLHTASKLMSSNVEVLIKAGSNVNGTDYSMKTPIHHACECSLRWDCVQVLVENGAELDIQDYRGYYPIHYIIEECQMSDERDFLNVINILITSVELANVKDVEGHTILHKAAAEVSGNVIEYLLKRGCKANVKDNRDRIPLHYVGKNKQGTSVVELLVKLGGSEINAQDVWDQSPLHTAIEDNNYSQVKLLVEQGACLNLRDIHGSTPLHMAAAFADHSIGELLIKMGAELNALDNYGSTPLHIGTWTNNYGFCRILLEHGGDTTICDKEGQTIMDIATSKRCSDIYKLFKEEYSLSCNEQIPLFSKYSGEILKCETVDKLINENSISRNEQDLQKYLSCILNSPSIGITLDEKEAREIHFAIEKMMKHLSEKIGKVDQRFSCTLLRAGSSSEGTKICFPDEFDFMFCLEEFSKYCYPVYEENDAKKRVKSGISYMPYGDRYEGIEEKTTSISDYFYIHLDMEKEGSKPFIEFANGISMPCYIMYVGFTKLIRKVIFSSDFLKDPRLIPIKVDLDPSLVFRWRGCRYKVLDIHVDIVPALRLKTWPIKTRTDSVLFTPELLDLPCVAVPKMTPGEDIDLWRCSLSLQETCILRNLKCSIKNSYTVAKAILNGEICPSIDFGGYEEDMYVYRQEHDSLPSDESLTFGQSPEDVVPSYVLKMAFLFAVEAKAIKCGLGSVFNFHEYTREGAKSNKERFKTYGPAEEINKETQRVLDVDVDLVKDLFRNCEEQLKTEFVKSFFNPKQNILGYRLVEGDVSKAHMFVRFVNELLK